MSIYTPRTLAAAIPPTHPRPASYTAAQSRARVNERLSPQNKPTTRRRRGRGRALMLCGREVAALSRLSRQILQKLSRRTCLLGGPRPGLSLSLRARPPPPPEARRGRIKRRFAALLRSCRRGVIPWGIFFCCFLSCIFGRAWGIIPEISLRFVSWGCLENHW